MPLYLSALAAFWTWAAKCVVCGQIRRGANDLFCGNFGANRGSPFEVCRRAWCGKCYTPHPLDNFHVYTPTDESGFEWRKNPDDDLRYKLARDGDHLLTRFQCHFCLFRLMTGRIPDSTNFRDNRLLCCLVRANLDAFWARETLTVSANIRNLDQLVKL